MIFYVLQRSDRLPMSAVSSAYLKIDHWNDYSFRTLFQLYFFDENGHLYELGDIKIGFVGQTENVATGDIFNASFSYLDNGFFSLGQSLDFYIKLRDLSKESKQSLLEGIKDIVYNLDLIKSIENEKVFGTSLLRDVSLATIKGQFWRVLNGMAALTDFKFKFIRSETDRIGGIKIGFDVSAETTPSTNIHAVIGRNGVGKTTLLNGMVDAITREATGVEFTESYNFGSSPISRDYFSSLVSVSFSAFDPFTPPDDQPDPAKGTCYFYLGLKDPKDPEKLRSLKELQSDCVSSLIACFSQEDRTRRWMRVIEELGSDENFSSMQLERLYHAYSDLRPATRRLDVDVNSSSFQKEYLQKCSPFLERMSSGHAVIFLIMTRLVAIVEEKTLVLLDEPESHLHPPLLSAFMRALADLLYDRNGIAIIATHSPVVLQEIPRSCVWKMYRVGMSVGVERPKMETFGENVGTLTADVFRLEVSRSGFHKLLAQSVAEGKGYDEILDSYGGQLGLEGRFVLKTLLAAEGSSS